MLLGNMQEIINILDSSIKKKLDEKILELIDLNAKDGFDPDMKEYIRIAEENNHQPQKEMLAQIASDIGLKFIEQAKTRQERRGEHNMPEKHIEDYLFTNISALEGRTQRNNKTAHHKKRESGHPCKRFSRRKRLNRAKS